VYLTDCTAGPEDAAVAALFERVEADSGALDLLVNNAAAISDAMTGAAPFWEKPLGLADVIDVGQRVAYVASWCAAPLLLRAERGLIVFTSSPGSVCYMHGPAYGAELAARYGITEESGRRPPSHRNARDAPRQPSDVVVR
jgi:NAD(P)-dependent dehydrogenase (short-subunit alcohol dehydrogenase family)